MMIEKLRKYIVEDEFRIIYFSNMVYVINYSKILDLNADSLSIMDNNKIYIIKGKNLTLIRLLDSEVLIKGLIKNIEVLYDK